MSVIGPDTAASGSRIPVGKYVAGVSDSFPRVGRTRIIESAIAGREKVEFLPINLSSDRTIDGRYLEFRIPGIVGRFLDLSSIALELKLSITSNGTEKLKADENATIVDAPVNSIFRAAQVYVGDRLVESNGFYNYSAYVKLLSTFKKGNLDTIGKLGYMNSNYEKETNNYASTNFPGTNTKDLTRMRNFKNAGINLKFPLCLDVATLDHYLLDGIPLRIRLELANNAWILGTAKDDVSYVLHINDAKLWLDKVIPQPNALTSLNESLSRPGKTINYVFNRTLTRTYALPANQDSIVIDLPWGQVIPDKLYIAIQDLQNYSGAYQKNGLFFQHAQLERLQVYINSVPIRSLQSNFPNEIAQLYFDTLNSIGVLSDTLVTHAAFTNGKTFFVVNFDQEDLKNVIPIEKSGNLRIELTFGERVDRNRIIFLFGDSVGVLNVGQDRVVTCDVRA